MLLAVRFLIIAGLLSQLLAQSPSGSAVQSSDLKIHRADQQQYVWIRSGQFRMGCSPGDQQCNPNESPAHDVEITEGFWLGQTEVTVKAWKRYRVATGKKPLPTKDQYGRNIWNESSQDEDEPAVLMSWKEASDYCKWLGGRLPLEAEWEYAARAGGTVSRYGSPDAIGWFFGNSATQVPPPVSGQTDYDRILVQGNARAHPVATKAPNAWGLYDMLGNVSEFVEDLWAENGYSAKPVVDPTGPRLGTDRIRRGGSWRSLLPNIRVSFRLASSPNFRDSSIGFRCVVDATNAGLQ